MLVVLLVLLVLVMLLVVLLVMLLVASPEAVQCWSKNSLPSSVPVDLLKTSAVV
jgi:hypothetical protein